MHVLIRKEKEGVKSECLVAKARQRKAILTNKLCRGFKRTTNNKEPDPPGVLLLARPVSKVMIDKRNIKGKEQQRPEPIQQRPKPIQQRPEPIQQRTKPIQQRTGPNNKDWTYLCPFACTYAR
jgi:hypothetical protein